jgi:hypothetical protein
MNLLVDYCKKIELKKEKNKKEFDESLNACFEKKTKILKIRYTFVVEN